MKTTAVLAILVLATLRVLGPTANCPGVGVDLSYALPGGGYLVGHVGLNGLWTEMRKPLRGGFI